MRSRHETVYLWSRWHCLPELPLSQCRLAAVCWHWNHSLWRMKTIFLTLIWKATVDRVGLRLRQNISIQAKTEAVQVATPYFTSLSKTRFEDFGFWFTTYDPAIVCFSSIFYLWWLLLTIMMMKLKYSRHFLLLFPILSDVKKSLICNCWDWDSLGWPWLSLLSVGAGEI